MNILYKYYSSSFDVKNHIESPSIKLSHVKSFNDPFEMQISHEHASMLAEMTLAHVTNKNDESKNEFINSYKIINSFFGVVSLTETHRNILMWSHYASSHKGVCVGYDTNFFEVVGNSNSYLPNDSFLNYSPQRVIYDSKRFDSEQQSDERSTINSILDAMRKKSDEWIYEKEHRCIVPFIWADKFKTYHQISQETENKIKSAIADSKIMMGEVDGEYEFNSEVENCALDFADNNEITILKNINLTSINSIYLGGKYDYKKTCEIKKIIESKPDVYGHIRLYKYEINPNNFSLDILPLSNVKLTKELDKETKDRISNYCL